MDNFKYQSPTNIIFGKGMENIVGEEITKYGSKLLFVHYGDEFIYKNGLYDRLMISIKNQNLEVTELIGVKPNPRLDLVKSGIKLCREKEIEFILAVGGGSVIDTCKAISLGVCYKGDIWDFFEKKAVPDCALPVGVVCTIPAAGSESSGGTVITNEEGGYKRAYVNDIIRPKFAILNPELTCTLPNFMTACGCADIMSHVMERYFTNTKNVELTDRLCEATLKTVINNARILLLEPQNYNARAEIMWSAVIAHNDLLGTGRISDYASHYIGHELSGKFDVTHGASLSIVTPAWMKYVYKNNVNRFAQFATRVWGIDTNFENIEDTAINGINSLIDFFKELGLPISLSELNINEESFNELASKCTENGSVGEYFKLNKENVVEILKLAK